ncbi:MAG: TPM domain-containing protein [Bacteroidales bacterium]|nr:TPM domain-containing protein [Bacteroidales bacterium]MBN2819429.1 TPM domain-containing protein [Bacteroidales bacterium]
MKKLISGIIILLLFQAIVFSRTERLFNDSVNLFSQGDNVYFENILEDFSNKTTSQIAVFIVSSFYGNDKAMYGHEILNKYGIGDEELDNGIVILLKPKTQYQNGDVYIAVGYGLEPLVPDAVAKRIVENEMIPSFKKNDYKTGIYNAINVLKSLSLKEYPAKEYVNKTKREERIGSSIFSLVVLIFIILTFFGRVAGVRRSSIGRSNLPLWLLISMLGSGRGSHSGSFGNFSSGRGSFGGGGFGGFGGGMSGGGGAGGSW